MEVTVFKTSVHDALLVKALAPKLNQLVGNGQWNFDLTDCDKILRIVSADVKPEATIRLMRQFGVSCDELSD